MEVIKLWVRSEHGGSYSQEEFGKMKKIKIITVNSCWLCHLFMHLGRCYHTEGLKLRLKNTGWKDPDANEEKDKHEKQKAKLIDRRRGRPRPMQKTYENWFSLNRLPASVTTATDFQTAIGNRPTCPFCMGDPRKRARRFDGEKGLLLHITKQHSASIAQAYHKRRGSKS